MANEIKYSIMNGKLLRFKLMNGKRAWIDLPSDEWFAYEANPSYQKRIPKKTNLQTNLFKNNEKTNF